jgi:hypothetical protein
MIQESDTSSNEREVACAKCRVRPQPWIYYLTVRQCLRDHLALDHVQVGCCDTRLAMQRKQVQFRERCSAVIRPPSHRMAARSSTLRSSLTLPGQWYFSSASLPSRVSPAGGRPNSRPISESFRSRKMSPVRSRSRGSLMSNTCSL